MLELALLYAHDGGHWWWGGAIFMIFFALIFLLIILKLFWWRPWGRPWGGRYYGWHDDEESILRRRLARGEITESDYERLRDLLRK